MGLTYNVAWLDFEMSPKSKKKSGKKEPNKPQLRARKKKNYKEVNEGNTFDEIDRSIERLGLIIKDVEGDGNCLFRALSDQMFGDESHHSELRQKVCDYIQENSEHFQNFFSSDDETLDKHLERMRNIGTFGDNFELVAFANMNSLDIHIYQDGSVNIMVIKGASLGTDSNVTSEAKQAVLHLAYHSWEHYSSIRNIAGPFEGLPEIDLDKIKQTLSEQQKQPNSELVSEQETDQDPEDINLDKPKSTSTSKEIKALERIQKVKLTTGCQDEEHIKSVLAENNNLYQKAVRVIKKQQREAIKAAKKAAKELKSVPTKSVQTKLDGFQGVIDFPNSPIEQEETSPNKIRKIELTPNSSQADSNTNTIFNSVDQIHPDNEPICDLVDNSNQAEAGLVSLNENKTSGNDRCDEDPLQLLDLTISNGLNQTNPLVGEGYAHNSSLDHPSLALCSGSCDETVADPSPTGLPTGSPKAFGDLDLINLGSCSHHEVTLPNPNPNPHSPVLGTSKGEPLAAPNPGDIQCCLFNNEDPNSLGFSSELKTGLDGLHVPDLNETPQTITSTINEEYVFKPLESTTELDQKIMNPSSSSPLKKKSKPLSKKKLNASPKKNPANDKTKSPPQLSYILI